MAGSLRRQITLGEVLDAQGAGVAASIYKVWPGIVTAYHAAVAGSSPATVDVQPAVHDVRTHTELGTVVYEPWPVLPAVPLAWAKGNGAAIQFPMAKGDGVTLLSYDLDPSAHRASGETADPIDTRRHGGSYWVALPFDVTDPGALADPGSNLVVLPPAGGVIALGGTSPTDAVALATKLDTLITVLVATYAASGTETGFALLVSALATWKTTNWTGSTTVGATKVKGV